MCTKKKTVNKNATVCIWMKWNTDTHKIKLLFDKNKNSIFTSNIKQDKLMLLHALFDLCAV